LGKLLKRGDLASRKKRQKSAERGVHEGYGSAVVDMKRKARVARSAGWDISLPSHGGLLPK
jgi:hypothetical protein